jgi:hypothetical protein
MVADFNIKPVGASAAVPFVEPVAEAAHAAVPTQLPAAKAVTAIESSLAARNNTQAESDRLSRQVVIDRAAAEVVYRVVDNRTSLVVRQFPDEARLRARAYLRAQDIAREEQRSHRVTDLKV